MRKPPADASAERSVLADIRFYHLTTTTLERALPVLLGKILARGDRAVVVTGSDARSAALDAALWTYDDRAFLPHGVAGDDAPEEQPVWLTSKVENPNKAGVLVLTDGAAADVAGWSMVLEIFDGGSDDAVVAARARWKAHKDAGHDLTYWKQSDQGRWEKAG